MNILTNFFLRFRKKNQLIEHKKKTKYILAIDGGGTRGLIPATVLEYMQNKMENLGSNTSIASYFDLIAGTSTGGLIALALSCPNQNSFLKPYKDTKYNSPTSIKDMYKNYAPEIFPKNSFPLRSFNQLWKSKYSDTSYVRLLKEAFDEIQLENSLVPVLAVSYDMIEGNSFNFTSSDTGYLKFKDAARATSAAPTYFDALTLKDDVNNKTYSLIDGGIIANNPSLFAYIEATKLYSDADNFVIATRKDLCGEHVGKTAIKTAEVFKSALGGVLFIDEAYSLLNDSNQRNSFGREAIDTLTSLITEYEGECIVILAGYKDDMEYMLNNANIGFKERFNTFIHFDDYTDDELIEIFKYMAEKQELNFCDSFEHTLLEIIKIKRQKSGKHFSNARAMKNLLQDIIKVQEFRLYQKDCEGVDLDEDDLFSVLEEDLEKVLEKVKNEETKKVIRKIGFVSDEF